MHFGERDSSCSCGCIFTEHRGRHSVGRQQAFHLKCITDFTWKQKMTAPSIRGNRQKKKTMASIDDEEHKCIEIISDSQSASRKYSSLILAHLSLFPLANTMPFVPKRIIRQRCRRQTIYWHFASLNSNVSLPGTIHFKQYVCCTFLGSDTSQHPENHSN